MSESCKAEDMMQATQERRRPLIVRTEISMVGKLHREGAPDVNLKLRNLSQAGFMAECEEPVPPGTNVILAVPGAGRIPAEIRWNNKGLLGALFHYELAAQELGLLAAAGEAETIHVEDEDVPQKLD